MRIGIDARYLYDHFTGVGRYTFNVIRHLAALDQRNTYVILKNKRRKTPIVQQKNFIETAIDAPPISIRTWFVLPWLLYQMRIDLLHSLFPIAPLYKFFPSVITVHDLQATKSPGFSSGRPFLVRKAVEAFYEISYAISLKKATKVIAVSNYTKAAVASQYRLPHEKVVVVSEGVEKRFCEIQDRGQLESFRGRKQLPARYILNIGNFRPHKNVDGLLKGYREFIRLNRNQDDIHLIIAGIKDRFFFDRKALADKYGLSQRVHFISYVDDEDLPSLYNCAEIFIMVSLFEGFGLPALEAMACGVPVVASNHSALPEVLGNHALLVNPFDPEAIGKAMQEIIRNKKLSKSLKTEGLARARHFTWETSARNTLGIYREILNV